MSLVINVVTPNFTLMVGDTKTTETVNDIPTGVYGEASKIFRINEYTIVGSAGYLGFSENVVNNARNDLGGAVYCDEVAKVVSKYALEEWAVDACCSAFLIAGLDSQGNISSYMVREEEAMHSHKIESEYENFSTRLGIVHNDYYVFQTLQDLDASGRLTIDSATQCCERYIKYLSTIYDGLNDKIEFLLVSK